MSKSRKKRMPKRVLALPDLEQVKSAVLNTLTSVSGQRTYDHAINDFVECYCSEPRVAFNRSVVLRYRIYLEQKGYAPSTINLRLAAVRRVAYEAADSGLLSPELAAGIRRVRGVRRLGGPIWALRREWSRPWTCSSMRFPLHCFRCRIARSMRGCHLRLSSRVCRRRCVWNETAHRPPRLRCMGARPNPRYSISITARRKGPSSTRTAPSIPRPTPRRRALWSRCLARGAGRRRRPP